MSLRNLHIDGNLDDKQLLKRSDGLMKNLIASFRQAAANGNFTFGPIKLQDADLNRVHSIVTEVDSRRLFFVCSENELPRYVMVSLYEARRIIRESSKGVWANPSCEVLVQEITATLNDFCSRAEKLKPEELAGPSKQAKQFFLLMTDMRLQVWLLVAMLKKKLGSIINPRNLPPEIWESVSAKKVWRFSCSTGITFSTHLDQNVRGARGTQILDMIPRFGR
jgi:hypothetical protein